MGKGLQEDSEFKMPLKSYLNNLIPIIFDFNSEIIKESWKIYINALNTQV